MFEAGAPMAPAMADAGEPMHATWKDYLALTKPRVISLLLFTTWTAMFIGAGGCRFMCSWDTQPEDVEMLAADLRAALAEEAGVRP